VGQKVSGEDSGFQTMTDEFESERRKMVDYQIRARGVRDPRVLAAMEKIPRHLFVPENLRAYAYADEPLPIGEGQTISQPFIVAYMTEALGLRGTERVLEVGTGSGYQSALLAELAREVFTIEIIESLSLGAQEILGGLGDRNVRFKVGDGSQGWPEEAPFDAIMVTAAAGRIPEALEAQLGPEGLMIVPVGTDSQELFLVRSGKKGLKRERLLPVRFVPLVKVH
jgi:protein-L-isoaspartate(D-aspartate) O-methyltransferase